MESRKSVIAMKVIAVIQPERWWLGQHGGAVEVQERIRLWKEFEFSVRRIYSLIILIFSLLSIEKEC